MKKTLGAMVLLLALGLLVPRHAAAGTSVFIGLPGFGLYVGPPYPPAVGYYPPPIAYPPPVAYVPPPVAYVPPVYFGYGYGYARPYWSHPYGYGHGYYAPHGHHGGYGYGAYRARVH